MSAPGARCGLHRQQEALVTCGRLGIAAYFTVPAWYLLTPLFWTVSRFFAFSWFAGRLLWSEILWLTAGPILFTVGVLNL